MGKHKIKKFGALRPNPTGLAQTGVTEDGCGEQQLQQELISTPNNDGSSQSIQEYVTNIIEKLQSPVAEERTCGCQMLTKVASHHKAIDILVTKDVSRMIYTLFFDPSLDVKLNVLGAVRNICVSGNVKVVNTLIENDILTPLSALIKQYKDDLPGENKEVPKKESKLKDDCPEGNKQVKIKDSKLDVLVQALKLLSVLCEGNPTTVSTFNKENLLQCILPKMDPEKYGYALACAIAQCLHVVSENNPELSKAIKAADLQVALLQKACAVSKDMDAILFRTLVTGVLLNMTEIDISPNFKTIIQKLSEVLAIDQVEVLKIAIDNTNAQEQPASEDSAVDVDKILQAQSICLELLANFCCSDDEWEDMDCDLEDSSDDQGSDQLTDPSGASVDDEAMDEEAQLHLDAGMCSAFLETEVIPKVLSKISPLDLTIAKSLQELPWGGNAASNLKDLQSRALLCLSNIVSAMDIESLSKALKIQDLWRDTHQLVEIAQGCSEKDEDYMWSVTSALRAVTQKINICNITDKPDISSNHLDILIHFGAQSQNHEIQINIIRTMSAIGCILAPQCQSHPMFARIGQCLIEVICNNGNLAVISESLDSIFDMFKEDNTDIVAREMGLLEKLKSVELSFKSKISSQRQMLGENYGVVMMAKENLKAFIKYKTTR